MSLAWSSKSLKATPVSADQLLIIDSEDAVTSTQNKRILLSAIPDLGEENTASNSGSGNGWAQTKSGVNLPFKSLITTSPISTTVNTNDLTLTLDALVNSDISSSAAIDFSKLASLTDGNILVGNSSTVVTSVTMSGDATIINTGALTVATNAITDSKIITHTTTKITTTSKSLLNTAIVYTDQTNTFGDFNQIFTDDKLFIQNPAETFEYQVIASAITADRTLTLPLLASNDTIVTESFTQTLTNKTFGTSNEFEDNTLVIQNPLNTFNYTIQTSAITAARTATIPLLTSGDTFVFEAHIQTLTNKTLTTPTLTTPTIASFTNATHDHTNSAGGGQLLSTTALSDTASIAYLDTANIYTAGTLQTFLGSTSGTSGVNVGGIAGNPTTQADGDVWLNTSTNQIIGRINGADVDLGASASSTPPFADTNSIVEGNVDATKELRFEVDGNTTGIVGVISTIFTTAKTVTIPDSTTTLAGLATAQSFTATQTFQDDSIEISNPLDTFQYLIQASAITIDLTATLPLLTTSDTFVFENHAQELTNKTFDGSNEFEDDGLVIQNPANTFDYTFQSSAITAARIITIPLLTAGDTLVTEAFTQTLTNKTFDLTNNTLTGTSAELATAISDETGSGSLVFGTSPTIASPTITGSLSVQTLIISGDLIVDGTTTSLNTETVNISDNHLYLNSGYTTTTTQTGGLVVNYLPTSTTTTVSSGAFVAGILTSSNPTVATVGAATFSANDLVQISASNESENDGLFEVLTHTSNVLTIKGVGITATDEDFTNNQFIANASDSATITKVTVSVLRSGVDGLWETASGSTTGFSFVDNVTLSATQSLTNKTFGTSNEFEDNTLVIQNPADTFNYTIQSSAITAARTLTIPLLTTSDTFAFVGFAQSFTATQTFQDDGIEISNPADTFQYTIQSSAITADRTLTLPLLTAGDTMVTEAFTQTLTNKTISLTNNTLTGTSAELATAISDETGSGSLVFGTSPTIVTPIIVSFTSATHDHTNSAGGGQLSSTGALSDTADIAYLNTANIYTAGTLQTFLGDTSGTSGVNVGGISGNPTTQADGDVWLNTSTNQIFGRINGADVDLGAGAAGEVFTWSANHSAAGFTLTNVGLLELNNPADTFQYIFTGAAITADRVLTLPLLTAADTLVTEAFTQTLTNKTLTTPTLTDPTIASFTNATHGHTDASSGGTLSSVNALSDTADIAYLNTANSYTAGTLQTFLGDTSGTSGVNVGGITGNPTTQADGDVWLNTSTNQIFGRINGANVDLGAGAAGEVFTWTAAHSMATFSLTATAANDVILDAPTSQATSLKVNGTEEYSFNATQADFNGNNLVNVGALELNNPANTFQYLITSAAITADRILNLPLLTSTDTLVAAAFAQTLTNKTIDGDDNTIIDINETQQNVSSGVSGTVLTSNGVGSAPTYQSTSGDMLLGTIQTVTAAKTFETGTLLVNNPANTFAYTVLGSAITAARTITLPLITGTDIFAVLGTAQSFTATQTFEDDGIDISNPADTFQYTIQSAAITAARTINLPLLTGNITLGDREQVLAIAASDETTALTAATNVAKFRTPFAFTVTEVRASLSTAGTGAALVTVDINESGTTILSTKITIDATETTSVTAATAAVISDSSLADDAEITIDIDTIDTGGVSAGLKVYLIGYRTP